MFVITTDDGSFNRDLACDVVRRRNCESALAAICRADKAMLDVRFKE